MKLSNLFRSAPKPAPLNMAEAQAMMAHPSINAGVEAVWPLFGEHIQGYGAQDRNHVFLAVLTSGISTTKVQQAQALFAAAVASGPYAHVSLVVDPRREVARLY